MTARPAPAPAPAAPPPARRRLAEALRRPDRRGPPDRRPQGPGGHLRPRRRPRQPGLLLPRPAPPSRSTAPTSASTPATANPASPADRERYPVTWGALIHECAHAAHTRWTPPPAEAAAWAEAARMLEESRIETAQTRPPARRPPLAPRNHHPADPGRLHRRRRRPGQPPGSRAAPPP